MTAEYPRRRSRPRYGNSPSCRTRPTYGNRPGTRTTGVAARWRTAADDGRAIIEVVFLAVLLLIPTVYILIGLLRLQAATLAVAQAARDVGRLIETSTTTPGIDTAEAVARIALEDQHIPTDDMRVRSAPTGDDCADSTMTTFGRRPGSSYQVCVTAIVTLPGVPSVIAGSRNTVTGVYTVQFSDLREGR